LSALHIVYVDTEANKADKMPLDYNNRECHDITDGYHPTKLMVNTDSMTGDEARTLARRITATLKWEVRLVTDGQATKLFVVPTWDDNGYRCIATYYLSVSAHRGEPLQEFGTYADAKDAASKLK
jgi:hypothetical protein